MLKYLKEDSWCCYVVTTLMSLGVVYFIKKYFSSNKPRREKQIYLSNAETDNAGLEKDSNLSEASNTTESKSVLDNYKVPDLFDSPEQETASLGTFSSVQKTQSTTATILKEESLPVTTPTSNSDCLTVDKPESDFLISKHQILSTKSLKPESEDWSSYTPKADFKKLPSESKFESLSWQSSISKIFPESSMSELETPSSVSITSEVETILPEYNMPEQNVIISEDLTSENLALDSYISEPAVSTVSEFENFLSNSNVPGHNQLMLETPAFRNLPSESSTSKLKNFPSASHVPEFTNLPLEYSTPELEALSSISHESEINNLPLESSMLELVVLSSIYRVPEFKNLPLESSKSEMEELPSIHHAPEFKILSDSQMSEHDRLLFETSTPGDNSTLSDAKGHLQQQRTKFDSLQHDASSGPLFPEPTNESIPILVKAMLTTLEKYPVQEVCSKPIAKGENTVLSNELNETDNTAESVPILVNAMLTTLEKYPVQEVCTKPIAKGENTVLSNELKETDNTALAKSNIGHDESKDDKFPLDTVPLEMIYKILPMSMQ